MMRLNNAVFTVALALILVPALALAQGGDDEGRRVDEVGRQADEQLALDQRLADEAEVEVAQVAKAAVDHLRGAARGADRVVVALDERHRVAA